MKRNYFLFLFFTLTGFAADSYAQCTSGCTMTVSGADASPHVIASGQTFCVTSSGSLSGGIVVQTGGILCNSGTITGDVWVNGGTLNNQGIINSGNILVDTQGTFDNFASADIDSLLVQDIYSVFSNRSGATLTGVRLAFTNNSSGTNDGTITEDYMGDSIGQFNNNLGGSLTLNYDLYNAYNSGFFNYGYMAILRDFLNSTGATFETGCMIGVGRDWYNSGPAIINGPATGSCGGFSVAGMTLNNGTIGSSAQHVDICDSGHPGTGIDGPGGTIASTTTYCACSNVCVAVGIAEHPAISDLAIGNVYPNPAKDNLNLVFTSADAQEIRVEVRDMMGRKHVAAMMSASAGQNKTALDVSSVAAGSYILVITDEKGLSGKQLFTVVK
ncbi:MAG: T9SS type A sorting domain-containing protein [Bacteroidia bacterium]